MVRMMSRVLLLLCTVLLALAPVAARSQPASRQIISLDAGWRFGFEPKVDLTQTLQPGFDDTAWQNVAVPHSWNAQDGQSIGESYSRGRGVYRLHFRAPMLSGQRQAWLEFQAVSMVADVWLNGQKLGHHAGGFAAFRLDATQAIRPGADNLLVVVADNSEPTEGSATCDVIPFSGDFNMLGGIYRDVSLITTGPVQIDLGDNGGAGVYVTQQSVTKQRAVLEVRTRLRSAEASVRPVTLRAVLRNPQGLQVAASETKINIDHGGVTVTRTLEVANPDLWDGTAHPALHLLALQVVAANGAVLDETSIAIGLRDIRFDPAQGVILNGKPMRLHGVAKHQDFINKGWATIAADRALDMAFVREIGANTIRLSHYQHNQSEYDEADRMGLIVYPELPMVDTPVPSETMEHIAPGMIENARQQLRELIRQNQNHASIAFWGIANEIGFVSRYSPKVESEVDALLDALRAEAKAADPSRPTIQANVGGRTARSDRDGLAALNRYYGWYDPDPSRLMAEAQEWQKAHPSQPFALSEYGFGASLTQHTDDPRVIAPENLVTLGRSAYPDFMPEEYQAWAHEQAWHAITQRPVFFATYVWNLFDFSAIGRKEGDYLTEGLSLNNKGLVSFDRQTRKDAFYFYKAQWNPEKMLHLNGHRYVNRSYLVTDVTAYTNLPPASLRLLVNGVVSQIRPVCAETVCRWPEVVLRPGRNEIRAEAKDAGRTLSDQLIWQIDDRSGATRIRVGSFAPLVTAEGARFGSDTFLTPASLATSTITGNKRSLSALQAGQIAASLPPFRKIVRQAFIANEPVARAPELFMGYREGSFTYDIPNADGMTTLVLSFFEPDEKATPGSRRFRILVNGKPVEEDFDIFAAAGNAARHAVQRRYSVAADHGRLRVSFEPIAGKAILSGLELLP